MNLAKEAFILLNNTNSSEKINIEKAKIYTLIAIHDELKTLNRILAAKFNIELVEEDKYR